MKRDKKMKRIEAFILALLLVLNTTLSHPIFVFALDEASGQTDKEITTEKKEDITTKQETENKGESSDTQKTETENKGESSDTQTTEKPDTDNKGDGSDTQTTEKPDTDNKGESSDTQTTEKPDTDNKGDNSDTQTTEKVTIKFTGTENVTVTVNEKKLLNGNSVSVDKNSDVNVTIKAKSEYYLDNVTIKKDTEKSKSKLKEETAEQQFPCLTYTKELKITKNQEIEVTAKEIEVKQNKDSLFYGKTYKKTDLFTIKPEELKLDWTISTDSERTNIKINEDETVIVPEYIKGQEAISVKVGDQTINTSEFKFEGQCNIAEKKPEKKPKEKQTLYYTLKEGYGQNHYVRDFSKLGKDDKDVTFRLFNLDQDNKIGNKTTGWVSSVEADKLAKITEGNVYLQMRKEVSNNTYEYSEAAEFNYDKTAPEKPIISGLYDGKNTLETITEGKWYVGNSLSIQVKKNETDDILKYRYDNNDSTVVTDEKIECQQGKHTYYIWYEDLAGNKSDEVEKTIWFTDKGITDKQVKVQVVNSEDSVIEEENLKNKWHQDASIRVRVEAGTDENHPDIKTITCSYKEKDESTTELKGTNKDGCTYFECKDGNLTYTITVTDEAGKSVTKDITVAKDSTAPSDEIYVSYESMKKNDESKESTIWHKLGEFVEDVVQSIFGHKIKLTLYVRDDDTNTVSGVSGIKTVEAELQGILKRTLELKKEETKAINISANKEEVYEVFTAIVWGKNENIQGRLHVTKVEDNAGNEIKDYENLTEADNFEIVADAKNPELTVDLENQNSESTADSEDEYIYYNTDQNPVFTVTDDYLTIPEKVQPEGTQPENPYTYKVNNESQEMVVESKSKVHSFTSKKLSAKENEEAEYKLTFACKDDADNELVAAEDGVKGGKMQEGTFTSKTLVIDKKAPVIQNIQFLYEDDDEDDDDDDYIDNNDNADDMSMTFDIVETYLNPEDVKITATNEGGDQYEFTISNNQDDEDDEDEDDEDDEEIAGELTQEDKHFTFKFDEEGKWNFKISAKDKAGNETTDPSTENDKSKLNKNYILDHTDPILSVVYGKDWDNIRKDKDGNADYFIKEDTYADICVIEKNFLKNGEQTAPSVTVEYWETDQNKVIKTEQYSEWNLEGNEKHFCKVPLNAEGHYRIFFSYHDTAGNRLTAAQHKGRDKNEEKLNIHDGKYTGPVITVDRSTPQIEIEVIGNKQGNTNCFQDAQVKMAIKVIEENFDPQEFRYFYNTYSYNEKGNKVRERIENQKIENWKSGFENGKRIWKTELKWNQGKRYEFSCKCTDISKRTGCELNNFTVDNEKPEIVIDKVEGKDVSDIIFRKFHDKGLLLDFVNYKDYSYFTKGKIFIFITAHDKAAGIKNINFKIKNTDKNEDMTGQFTNDQDILEGIWTNGRAIMLNSDFKGYIQAQAVDGAGNQSNPVRPRGAVSETDAKHKETMELEIDEITQPSNVVGKHHFYNKPVELHMLVKDTHSGIASYEYQAGSKAKGTKDYREAAGIDDIDYDSIGNRYEIENYVTMDAGDVNYSSQAEPTKAELTYVDNVGHVEKIEKEYIIDDHKPEITVEWSSEAKVQNKKYYNKTRTARIKVIERNFDEQGVTWDSFGESGKKGVEISPWTHEGDVHTATVSFTKDGDFDLKFTVEDYATNKATWDEADEFVIDKTVPVLSIAFDNNQASNGKYYKAARTATLHIEEHNFRASDVNYEMTAVNDGKGVERPGAGGWSTGGDKHTASIRFAKDGDYTLAFNYTDLAGNKAERAKADAFTIDLTKPVCEITNINDHSANNDTVTPGIKFSDINLENYKVTLTGNKNGVVNYDTETPVGIHNGKTQMWKDFERKESVDDIYTMDLTVTDKAGNQSVARKLFSVNRFGSNYLFGENTKKLLENYYTNKEIELDISEVNVNTLKEKEVTVRDANNQLVTLKEGTDYTVSQKSNKYNWNEYNYKIKADNFKNENQYTVTLYSEDKASNKMNNESKDKSIEFVVDKTAPTGVISGLEETRYREDKHDIYVHAMDNYQLDKAYLVIDGKEYREFSAKDFDNQDQSVKVKLDSKNGPQHVGLKLVDRAGNTGEVKDIKCIISASHWVQFVNNKPVFYSTAGVGGAAVLGVIGFLTKGFGYATSMATQTGFWWILLGKKKKDEEAEDK